MTLAAALALLLPLMPAPLADGPFEGRIVALENARGDAVVAPIPDAPMPPLEAPGFDL